MLNHMEGVLNWTIFLSYLVILYFCQQYESSRCSTIFQHFVWSIFLIFAFLMYVS